MSASEVNRAAAILLCWWVHRCVDCYSFSNAKGADWSIDGQTALCEHGSLRALPGRAAVIAPLLGPHPILCRRRQAGAAGSSRLDVNTRIGSCNRHPRTQSQAQRRQDPPSRRQSLQGHRRCSRCLAGLAAFAPLLWHCTPRLTDADSDHPPRPGQASCKCNLSGTIRGS